MQRALMMTVALVTVILAAPVAADDPAKGGVAVTLQFSQYAGLYYATADLGGEFRDSPADVQLAPCGVVSPMFQGTFVRLIIEGCSHLQERGNET